MTTQRLTKVIGAAALALGVLGAPLSAFAQETISSASISGRVTDPQGGVVPGAQVTARQTETNVTAEATTGPDGRFRFPYLKVGPYQVKVHLEGFTDATRALTLTVGAAYELPVALRVGGVETGVTVTADAIVLEAARTQIAGTVSQAEVRNLPMNGRQFLDIALLVPGVSPPNLGSTQLFAETSAVPGVGVSVGSQRNFSNNLIVDGLSSNDDAAGLTGMPYGVDAVDQFQVVTSGGQAELGRALGGYVNVLTKSGTNVMHGDVYDYARDDKFNAANALSGTTLPMSQAQYGFSLGGHVSEDVHQGDITAFDFGGGEHCAFHRVALHGWGRRESSSACGGGPGMLVPLCGDCWARVSAAGFRIKYARRQSDIRIRGPIIVQRQLELGFGILQARLVYGHYSRSTFLAVINFERQLEIRTQVEIVYGHRLRFTVLVQEFELNPRLLIFEGGNRVRHRQALAQGTHSFAEGVALRVQVDGFARRGDGGGHIAELGENLGQRVPESRQRSYLHRAAGRPEALFQIGCGSFSGGGEMPGEVVERARIRGPVADRLAVPANTVRVVVQLGLGKGQAFHRPNTGGSFRQNRLEQLARRPVVVVAQLLFGSARRNDPGGFLEGCRI